MTLVATTPRNTDIISTYEGKTPIWPIYNQSTINQGDLVVWDSGSNLGVRTPANQADMAYYIGVAEQTNPLTSLLDQLPSMKVARAGNIVWFYTTSGETYNPGDKVFFNETASVQTIVKSSNSGARTIYVGYYLPTGQTVLRNPNPQAGSLSITGGAGVVIPIWLTPNWPLNPNGAAII